MLVKLTGQKSIMLDLPCELTFSTSNSQSFGSAKLTIPRHSAAWNPDIISERGGFLVQVFSQVGNATLIANTPVYTPTGMTVEALHVTAWCDIRHVSPSRTLVGMTAGAIAQLAVKDALMGLGSVPITIGPILQAPPIVNEYRFQRQTLLSVLTDLQKQTGQQWQLDESLQFRWVSQTGKYREFVLIDDGRFLDRLQRTPLADQHRERIEVEQSGRTFTAHDRTTPLLWPSQEIVRL